MSLEHSRLVSILHFDARLYVLGRPLPIGRSVSPIARCHRLLGTELVHRTSDFEMIGRKGVTKRGRRHPIGLWYRSLLSLLYLPCTHGTNSCAIPI
jgi:hypothetical protein